MLKPEQCEICGCSPVDSKKDLVYDHDHLTGKFRGWLCSLCNTGLGSFKDNPFALIAAAEYIKKHRGEPHHLLRAAREADSYEQFTAQEAATIDEAYKLVRRRIETQKIYARLTPSQPSKRGRPTKITAEVEDRIHSMRDSGLLAREIAKTIGVSRRSVYRILSDSITLPVVP